VKLGYRDRLGRDEAVELAVAALYEAADEDTATAVPIRSGASTRRGDRRRRGLLPPGRRSSGRTLQPRPRAPAPQGEVVRAHDDALLRGAEQVMKDRAEYAKKASLAGAPSSDHI